MANCAPTSWRYRHQVPLALERIAPNAQAWDAAGEVLRPLYGEAARLGLARSRLSGSPGRHARALCAAQRDVGRAQGRHGGSGGLLASLFSHIGLRRVLRHGVRAVQQEVVPPVLRGEKISALAITEPGAASTWPACAPRPREAATA